METKELSPERRNKVGNACGWDAWPYPGMPLDNARYRDLTQTAARLIEERERLAAKLPKPERRDEAERIADLDSRLRSALATGDTNALEHLLSEMLEDGE